jgi:hypothetical protein
MSLDIAYIECERRLARQVGEPRVDRAPVLIADRHRTIGAQLPVAGLAGLGAVEREVTEDRVLARLAGLTPFATPTARAHDRDASGHRDPLAGHPRP